MAEGDTPRTRHDFPRLFDTVKLACNPLKLGLRKGMVGAVVAVSPTGGRCTVEFADSTGRPLCEAELEPSQFVILRRYHP